eukprot:scaffold673354_cov81-Prasinocladus_malaysianus.AAC.1
MHVASQLGLKSHWSLSTSEQPRVSVVSHEAGVLCSSHRRAKGSHHSFGALLAGRAPGPVPCQQDVFEPPVAQAGEARDVERPGQERGEGGVHKGGGRQGGPARTAALRRPPLRRALPVLPQAHEEVALRPCQAREAPDGQNKRQVGLLLHTHICVCANMAVYQTLKTYYKPDF